MWARSDMWNENSQTSAASDIRKPYIKLKIWTEIYNSDSAIIGYSWFMIRRYKIDQIALLVDLV